MTTLAFIFGLISIEQALNVLIFIVIAGLIFWLLWWGLGKIALPEPFAKIANVLLVLFAVLVLIGALLQVAGHPIVRW